jgi:hypothetical protein
MSHLPSSLARSRSLALSLSLSVSRSLSLALQEELAFLSPLLAGVGVLAPLLLSRLTTGPAPLRAYLLGLPLRLLLNPLYLALVPLAADVYGAKCVARTFRFDPFLLHVERNSCYFVPVCARGCVAAQLLAAPVAFALAGERRRRTLAVAGRRQCAPRNATKTDAGRLAALARLAAPSLTTHATLSGTADLSSRRHAPSARLPRSLALSRSPCTSTRL